MTARASVRSVRSLMRKVERGDKLNILTFATHERYEENLCRTGHNFYSLRVGKEWDTTYAEVPHNYHIVSNIPSWLDIDLVLSHTSCNRIQVAHDLLSGSRGQSNKLSFPILRHCHVLPDIRFDTAEEISSFRSIPVDATSFISNYSRDQWGFNDQNSSVVEHGIDSDFWNDDSDLERSAHVLSVVNEFPSRDWCCGFKLWKQVTKNLPVNMVGKCTGSNEGFSLPARDSNHLRDIYRASGIFLNTSIHSPVPTVLMEAMACGCAIVSTSNCMIPEIIKHGENGLISNNPDEIRANIEYLLYNELERKRLGKAARETIVRNFSLTRFVERWNDLLYTTVENYARRSFNES